MTGKSDDKLDRVPVAVYLEPELATALKRQAAKERRTISMQAGLYIERGLKELASE
jgi:hypothetical protein